MQDGVPETIELLLEAGVNVFFHLAYEMLCNLTIMNALLGVGINRGQERDSGECGEGL